MCSSENHVASLSPHQVVSIPPIFTAEAYSFQFTKAESTDPGTLRQISSLHQCNTPEYQALISKHKTPQMICGFTSTATALMLSNFFPRLRMDHGEVEEMIAASRSADFMAALVDSAMALVQQWRSTWIERSRHALGSDSPFESRSARRKYMSDWVANYEISDLLRTLPDVTSQLHFARHIERSDDVEHEERERVVEEERFRELTIFIEQAHRADPPDHDPSSCIPRADGSKLLAPSEWLDANTQYIEPSQDCSAPVFICDCLGHFVCVRPVILIDPQGTETRTLIVFNSLGGNYVLNRIVALLYRMFFERRSELDDLMFQAATRNIQFQ